MLKYKSYVIMTDQIKYPYHMSYSYHIFFIISSSSNRSHSSFWDIFWW